MLVLISSDNCVFLCEKHWTVRQRMGGQYVGGSTFLLDIVLYRLCMRVYVRGVDQAQLLVRL